MSEVLVMGEINLRAAAHHVASPGSPWEALKNLQSLAQEAEVRLSSISEAELRGLVRPGTYEKAGSEIFAVSVASRAGLAAAVREMDRILASTAASGAGRVRPDAWDER